MLGGTFKETTMKPAILLAFALVGALTGRTQAAEPSAKVIEYGRYLTEIKALAPATGTSGGVLVSSSTKIIHVETTRRIPARAGSSYGFKYEISNLPADRPFVLRSVTRHPPIKQPDGTVMTKSVTDTPHEAGDVQAGKTYTKDSHWHFVKGYEYEFVPGTWTEQVYIDDKMVLEEKFEVYKP